MLTYLRHSEVGPCNTVHILCMPVTCIYALRISKSLEAYRYGSPWFIHQGMELHVLCILSNASLMTQSKQRLGSMLSMAVVRWQYQ